MGSQVRSVVVRLSASSAGYVAGLGPAEAANARVEGGLKRIERRSVSTDTAMRKIGGAGKFIGLAAGAGIAIAEKKAADFNEKMALVGTLSHASAKQMVALGDSAKSVGVNIGYSATSVADAEAEMIKAGVSVKDILGGSLKGALDLAAAGQTDVASATEIAAAAMTQFKLKGKDVPHIADLLAAGADKALGSVTDLGYALSQVGTTADQMGYSIEGTTGTLAEFAQAGLTGEKGGSVLKQMLLQLSAPTKQAKKLMDEYGISLYDANGQVKSFPELAGNLQKSFKDLDPASRNAALGIIFGSRAIQGANILIKDGEKGNRKWIKSVDDQGFAAHQASGKMDSLKGDLKKLNAELGNALIEGGGKQGFLRGMTQDVTGLIKKFNRLSDAQKSVVSKVFVGAAATGGALWVASKMYRLFKDTAAISRGIFGGGKALAGKALGKGALGAVASKGVVPVYVTNMGPGLGKPGPGMPGGGVPEPTTKPPKPSKWGNAKYALGALGGGALLGLGLDSIGLNPYKNELRQPKGRLGPIKLPKGYQKSGESKDDAGRRYAEEANAHVKAAAAAKRHAEAVAGLRGILGGTTKKTKDLTVATDESAAGAVAGGSAFGDYFGDIAKGPKKKSTKVDAPGLKSSKQTMQDYIRTLAGTPKGKTTRIAAPGAARAKADVAGLGAAIAGLHDKTVNIHVARTGASLAGMAGVTGARGLYLSYAAGGMDRANAHGPEYAKPGALARVWLEPETQGESYIPHANDSRRPRAKSILNKTAALFGGRVSYNASGSISGARDSIALGGYTIILPPGQALTLAKRLAYEASAQAKSARAATQAHIDDLNAQKNIRDIQRELNAMEGKKHHRHHELQGLDRKIAQAELAQAKKELYATRHQAAIDETSTLAGAGDIFARGTGAQSALHSVEGTVRDIGQFGTVVAQLKSAGASPALLSQVLEKGNSGDFRSAIRLGKALLAQPATLKQLNASLASLGTVSGSVAGLVTDPRFLSNKAWAGVTSKVVQVNIGADPTTWMVDIRRTVRHEVEVAMKAVT